jgi:hypothetical protein
MSPATANIVGGYRLSSSPCSRDGGPDGVGSNAVAEVKVPEVGSKNVFRAVFPGIPWPRVVAPGLIVK